mgnify:CR=1 FL=1
MNSNLNKAVFIGAWEKNQLIGLVLGTNIEGPGINYILSNFNISLSNKEENGIYTEERHNFIIPILSLIIFSYMAIRYFNKITTSIIYIFIYTLLVYILVFKICRGK